MVYLLNYNDKCHYFDLLTSSICFKSFINHHPLSDVVGFMVMSILDATEQNVAEHIVQPSAVRMDTVSLRDVVGYFKRMEEIQNTKGCKKLSIFIQHSLCQSGMKAKSLIVCCIGRFMPRNDCH